MPPADHSFRGALSGLCLIACDLGTSITRRPTSELGCRATGQASKQAAAAAAAAAAVVVVVVVVVEVVVVVVVVAV